MRKTIRCAVYTRKSSDEGLDQEFNSLHAQREACEAYIKSQVGEGWFTLKTAYDDGGFSGGSMIRPALKALMADIEAGQIDVVVVYKVDRLTRSLTDFARIVEIFDRKGVSFVSVTQAFNTTSSMGRLTLNVLLSFAQFEREVTSERIRDKIAASKAKGMWMGGNLALGYDVKDRRLVVNPSEAEFVRALFRRCLELGSVHALKLELDARGAVGKTWTTSTGTVRGGAPFSRGALFHLLKNRLYIGEVPHKDKSYPGLHEAIVDHSLFDAVQSQLAMNAVKRDERRKPSASAPLKGLVFDNDGDPMTPTVATGAGGRSFRYYVSSKLQRGVKVESGDDAVRRISAPQLFIAIQDRLARIGVVRADDGAEVLCSKLRRIDVRSSSLQVTLASEALPDQSKRALSDLAAKLGPDDELVRTNDALTLIIGVRPVFRGGRTWLINPSSREPSERRVNNVLLDRLRQAHRLLRDHQASLFAAADGLVNARSPTDSYERKVVALAFLAPDIQRAIVDGTQPQGLTAHQLLSREIPLEWNAQRKLFGFPVIASTNP